MGRDTHNDGRTCHSFANWDFPVLIMAISLAFENEQIRQTCESSRSAKRRLGVTVAAQLQVRLADLKALDAASDVIDMGFARLDPSEDTRLVIPLGCEYVLRVAAHHRPEPRSSTGKLDWKNVTRIKILAIECTGES